MYRYSDKRGNVFELHEEERRLVFAAQGGKASEETVTVQPKTEKPLTAQEYMQLISAFSVAIDNKIIHRELCNPRSGVISTWENGHQRRYILSDQSAEMQALEMTLYNCIH